MFSASRQLVARTDSFSSARHIELGLEAGVEALGHRHAGRSADLRAELAVLHERVEVLAEDLGRLDQCHLRSDRAVGPDLHRQLVVVGLLADAGLLDLVADAESPG